MLTQIRSLLRNLFRSRQVNHALDEELQSSVDILTKERIAAGLTPSEARRQALIELGGVEQAKEQIRDAQAGHVLHGISKDLRFALRTLANSPGFTCVTVLTLALGIGANTAFFGVLNRTLLRPLPYPEPERLVHLNERSSKSNAPMPVAYPNFVDWKLQQTSFSALSIYHTSAAFNLRTDSGTDRVPVALVDHDFLKTLGVPVARGRDLTAGDDRTGAPLAVLLTQAAWAKRFHSDPNVIGSAVQLDEKPATIVGILPPEFQFYRNCEVFLPLGPLVNQMFMQTRDTHSNAMVVGRLKPGLSLQAAKDEMDSIAAHLAAQYPKSNSGLGVTLTGYREYLTGDARQGQLLLMSAVGLILLIVCVNVATLTLARSCARDREMAVRAALGASRGRLVRQLLVECLLVASIGGSLGLLLAAGLSTTLTSLVPFQVRQLDPAGSSAIDLRVAAFAFLVTFLTGLLSGLAPAWQLSHTSPNDALKDRGAAGASSPARSRTAGLLVTTQVGLATLLVIASGLVIQSLRTLSSEPLGYKPEHVLSLRLASPEARVNGSLPRIGAFYTEAWERLARLPGVESAAVASSLAFGNADSYNQFRILDRPIPAPSEYPSAQRRTVSPDYFRTMGIPLLQGRGFDGREPALSVPPGKLSLEELVAAIRKLPLDGIVTRSFAQRYWPGENPIGKRFMMGPPAVDIAVVTVIGVVGDSSQVSLGQTNHEEFYLSLRQFPAPGMDYALILRTRGDPAALIQAARAELRQMTVTEAAYDALPLSDRIAGSIATQSFRTQLLTWFAAIALLLASVGLYGVLAFHVGRRSREIGVRIALGASPASVVKDVFFRGFALVLPGLALGLLGAWASGRYLQSQLYRVSPTDPLIYAAGTLALLLAATLACWLPAHRAAHVDPLTALRDS